MKYLLITLFIINCLLALSQNTAFKCIKTSWPLIGGSQIDTYNETGKRLRFIRLNERGDTSQYWKYIYNPQGILIRSFSVIEYNNPFDYRFIIDSLGNTIAKISMKSGNIDTIPMSISKIEKNKFGDPIFDDRYGNISYTYDSMNRKIKETFTNEFGQKTGIGFYFYNDSGQKIKYKWYENNRIKFSYEYKYDSKGNLITEIRKRGRNKLMSVQHNEYLPDGFLFRACGIEYATINPEKWEMKFEIINCEQLYH